MEKAGQSIDNATESVGDHVEYAGEAIQDAAKVDNYQRAPGMVNDRKLAGGCTSI